jgi:hypothetical protein
MLSKTFFRVDPYLFFFGGFAGNE